MIKWFLQREWLSVSVVGSAALIVFVSIDFLFQGPVAVGPAALIASSLFFSRRWPYVGTALVTAGTIWQLNSVAAPLVSGAASALSLLLVAAPLLSPTSSESSWCGSRPLVRPLCCANLVFP
ncbi:MAG: hypothetical protein RI919_447 [Actinomycetota bacterium]